MVPRRWHDRAAGDGGMKPDERQHSTYLDHAVADTDLAAGGRFAKVNAVKVTGVPAVPTLPQNSPFASDPVPPEPQLGVDVNAMQPVGTEAEIEKSIRDLGGSALEAPVAVLPSVTVEPERGPPIPSTLRRRAR
jgi:hypothetical protein